MAGASIDAIGVINQIKDNLTDRYDNGFPVLKEIIQNADDAGAHNLTIGWSKGFENANNELLNAPAIFFINDAPLEEEHRDAILSIAQSSKAASKTSVGKFGLGMKSLFHLGEAFFFMSEQWEQHAWASDVFNPWDKYRPNWNEFDDQDKANIVNRLKSLLGNSNQSWFIVWVPLRTQALVESKQNKMIINNVSDGYSLPDFFSENHLAEKTSEILPQLKHLTNIAFYKESSLNDFDDLTKISLVCDSTRSEFNGEDLLSSGQTTAMFQGKINAEVDYQTQVLEYAGCEQIISDVRLKSLKTEEMGWPKSYQFDRNAQEPVEALDKAEQHAAVTFSRFRATGQAYLRANWAVFLPLADTDELVSVPIDGDYDYNLYLHGYFFVDAGRKGLHGHEQLGGSVSLENVKNDEKRLRQVWNIVLASEGTFNLVLKALDRFCEQFGVSHKATSNLTCALHQLLTGANDYKKEVVKPYNWLLDVTEEQTSWKLLAAGRSCLPIPKPLNNDQARIWATLPKLKALLSDKSLYLKCGYEFLSPQNTSNNWSAVLLASVIGQGVSHVFEKSIYIEYLNQFLEVVSEGVSSAELDSLLIPLFKKVLIEHSLPDLSANRATVASLFSKVTVAQSVILPLEKEHQDVWEQIAQIEIDKLLVPKFLAEQRQGKYALLSENDLLSILNTIDVFLNDGGSDLTKYQSTACERMIELVMSSAKSNPHIKLPDFFRLCSHLKLFRVDAVGAIQSTKFRSLDELTQLRSKRQLFTKEGHRDFGRGLAKPLSASVPGIELCFIPQSQLFMPSELDGLEGCHEASCLSLLATYPTLGSISGRIALLKELSDEFTSSDHKRGLRYLVHGSNDDNLTQQLWKRSRVTQPVWMKVWQMCQPEGYPEWCLIEPEFEQVLRNQHAEFIGLKEQHYSDIIEAFRSVLPHFDFSAFEDWELAQLLVDIGSEGNKALWQAMPIHVTKDDQRVAITTNCLMEGNTEIPSELHVTIIKRSDEGALAACQQKWVNNGLPAELVAIALMQENPNNFEAFILEQLNMIRSEGTDIPTELRTKIEEICWLNLLGSGQCVSPSQVLKFPQNSLKETTKICKELDSPIYHISELPSDTAENHELGYWVTSNKITVGVKVLSEASKYRRYALGKMEVLTQTIVEQANHFDKITNILPGWSLLAELFESNYLIDSENKQKMLCIDTDTRCLVGALEQIADKDRDGFASELRVQLLGALCRTELGVSFLSKVRLKNQKGEFVLGKTLVNDVAQVDKKYLIDTDEYQVIKPYCSRIYEKNTANPSGTLVESGDNAEVLRTYFEEWESRISMDAIATFVALFCKHENVEKLANGYLRNTTLDTIRKNYQSKWAPYARDRGPFSGHSFNSLYKAVDFKLAVCAENTSVMSSIFGDPVEVELIAAPDSLLIHQRSSAKIKRVELRKIDPKNTDKEQLIRLLAKGIEALFQQVFGAAVRFEADFTKAYGHSEQTDIQVTRQIILNNLVPLLERLQVRDEGLADLQRDYNRETRALVLTDQSVQQDRTKLSAVLSKIQKVMESNAKVQKSVLNAVRKEISKHFQYSPYSVPFELLQNADDALSELNEMTKGSAQIIPRFDVFIQKGNELNFCHWGREVNYCASSYVAGKNRFERDLEKMVSLNVSDKADGKTGKFGLGFKSSLLLSDTPRIVSGDICAEIQAGVLPKIPSKKVMESLNNLAEENSVEAKIPTLIQLPGDKSAECIQASVLGRFENSAGLLTVFSRHIRELNINGKRFSWNGKTVSNLPSVVVGEVKLPTNSSTDTEVSLRTSKVLVVTTKSGQFVFALDKSGVISLGDRKKLSNFWVLNPIDEDLKLGFCINSQFAVDIGRSQLAVDNAENIVLAKTLGKELASVFASLYQSSVSDWNQFAEEIGLDQKATPSGFWHSIWNVLTTLWPTRLSTDNSKAELIRNMFTCPDGLLDFYKKTPALPTKLTGERDKLICLKEVDVGAARLLSSVYSSLNKHERLQKLSEQNRLVGNEVYDVLASIGFTPQSGELKKLDLLDLMKDDLTNFQVPTEKAEYYGALFTDEFESKISKSNTTLGDKRDLEAFISKMCFKNQAGVYVAANKLVVKGVQDHDLLSCFAPKAALLNEQYDKAGEKLVALARTEADFDSFSWAQQIASNAKEKDGKQDGLCTYMVKGANTATLIQKLKSNTPNFMQKGIFDPNVLDKWQWTTDQKSRFVSLWIDSDTDKERHVRNVQKDFVPNVNDSDTILANIVEWWSESRNQHLKDYDSRLYSRPMPWKLMAEDFSLEELETRKGWLKLFYLGCCQTLGYANENSNRNVVEWFEDKGWWDKLADAEGPKPEAWNELMDEYLQTAKVDERYRVWVQILPLYRFATKLQNYVELFMNSAFISDLSDLLQPNSSSLLSGSGIDVSELKGTLGIGINFIMRELVRNNVIDPDEGVAVHKYSFVLPARVRHLMKKTGANLTVNADPENSERVYDFLCQTLPREDGHLGMSFDIPFRILLENKQAFKRCFDFDPTELEDAVYE